MKYAISVVLTPFDGIFKPADWIKSFPEGAVHCTAIIINPLTLKREEVAGLAAGAFDQLRKHVEGPSS